MHIRSIAAFLTACLLGAPILAAPPNVVLVITDDQGYGDLGCHGNPHLRTPAIDALAADSVRLMDYHVDPTCSPTRAALMTGRYSSRAGVWHTVMGRSLLREDETVMANLFLKAGYATAMFGKWHLGDNPPLRPQDRGFEEVFMHGGGGVGQTPDAWGNLYFDDVYLHNGTPERTKGYCTDVWFDAAMQYIEANRAEPFFVYLATNAPHAPYNVAKEYSQPYRDMGVPSPRAEFYGMIANIDENVARLRAKLDDLGLAENTILIFTTDNGSAAGTGKDGGYNAGMRGAKGSQYDGGHRVPCFAHWPAGGWTGGRNVDALTAHIDLFPTLADACNLRRPDDLIWDGTSLRPLLDGEKVKWPERTLFVHSQRIDEPEKWRQSAVMTERWRLVDGKELYDVQADPAQATDFAGTNDDVVEELRSAYDEWWDDMSERFDEYVRIEVGFYPDDPTTLTAHDWHAPIGQVPWNQDHIERDLPANGFWTLRVKNAGTYRVTLRNRPAGYEASLNATRARVRIFGNEVDQTLSADATEVRFELSLPEGETELQTWLENDESSRGAYFVEVERVPDRPKSQR